MTTGCSCHRALRVSKNCRYTGPSTAPCFCLHPYFPTLNCLHLLFAYIPPTLNDPVWYTLCKKFNWFIHTIKANINKKILLLLLIKKITLLHYFNKICETDEETIHCIWFNKWYIVYSLNNLITLYRPEIKFSSYLKIPGKRLQLKKFHSPPPHLILFGVNSRVRFLIRTSPPL